MSARLDRISSLLKATLPTVEIMLLEELWLLVDKALSLQLTISYYFLSTSSKFDTMALILCY
ncbi:hypothetical protein Ple7327_1623 [Pleurocapsa sp. PCC 7327]|nr:hypothetical protein Ple7327_1623 [Pleurocapsa sp. PCC 7327]